MKCPRCQREVDGLQTVETGTRVALQATGQSGIPPEVCISCISELATSVSHGFKLRTEQQERDKHRISLWKGRVGLVKAARASMTTKSYSEAAVAYEKYLRVLELVNNLGRGELSPTLFSSSTRSKEMTVIASVYWDLVRIYDSHPAYGDRMNLAARKLSEFLPFSPLYPDIIKRAESFARYAKHPEIVRDFLRKTKSSRGPCFVATAVFEEDAPELILLRRFRDQHLRTTKLGRRFIYFYYQTSPGIADWLRERPAFRRPVKQILKKIAVLVQSR